MRCLFAFALVSCLASVSGVSQTPSEEAASDPAPPEVRVANAAYRQLWNWIGLGESATSTTTPPLEIEVLNDISRSYYDISADVIAVPAGASPDAVRHEVGHAFVDRLKPGWTRGVAKAAHEAVADATAFLLAYLDAADEIGEEGGMPAARDAASMGAAAGFRSAMNSATADSIGFDPRRHHLAEIFVPNTLCDPYYVSQPIAGAFHDLLWLVIQESRTDGTIGANAVRNSVHEVGRIMTRALMMAPEHRVSFVDIACAAVSAESYFPGNRMHVARAFAGRGIAARMDGAEFPGDGLPAIARIHAPCFPPSAPATRFIDWLVLHENALLERAGELTFSQRVAGAASDLPFLFHRTAYPHRRTLEVSSVRVDRELSVAEGCRYIGVAYECPVGPETERLFDLFSFGDAEMLRRFEWTARAHASYLFDQEGRLIVASVDRPIPKVFY